MYRYALMTVACGGAWAGSKVRDMRKMLAEGKKMDADQITRMTPAVIRSLIDSRRPAVQQKQAPGNRREERWPFAGTVEVWLPDDCYGERHLLATLHNLSAHGLAMRSRRPIPTGTRLSLALHQPECTCYGEAVVRHCTRAAVGYLIGVEFDFTEKPENEE
jgi:hypothetical protein